MSSIPHTHARSLRWVGILVAALVVGACGNASDTTDAPTATDTPESTFPVTMDTAYGEITLTEKPERIVALTHNFVDILVSLDVQPVVIAGGGPFDAQTFADTYPWLDGLYTGEIDAGLVSAEYAAQSEAIAVWEPDLILGDPWMINEELYKQLSQIAPTYAGLSSSEATLREDHITTLGALVGKTQEAEQVLADIDSRYAAARDRLPGLQGATYNSVHAEESGFRFVEVTEFSRLGMVLADSQTMVEHEVDSNGFTSLENLEQIDGEVLAVGMWSFPGAQQMLEADPRFAELPASVNSAVVYFDSDRTSARMGLIGDAWALEGIVKELEASTLNADQ